MFFQKIFRNQFYKGKFVRNVIAIATGTAIAQAVTMAFAPLITRLYGPEAFGVLGVFMSFIAIVTPVAALTYPIAIVLPKSNENGKKLIKLSLYVAVFMAVLVSVLLLLFHRPIVKLLQIEVIASLLFFMPLIMLFDACFQVAQQWLIRQKQFAVTAKVTVAQAFIVNSAKSGVGLFYPTATALVAIATFGQMLHAGMLALGAKYSKTVGTEKKVLSEQQSSATIKELAYRHRDFPYYRAPEVFINALSQSLPVLMLAGFFGPASAGFYTICRSAIALPSQLIGKSVGDVFYPHITDSAHRGAALAPLVLKATLALAVVGVVPFALIIAFGPPLFGFFFGSEWITAGQYARWLALWLFFGFLNNPSVKTLPVLLAQGFHLMFTFITITIRISALAVGYYLYNSDMVAVMLFGISGALTNLVFIALIIRKCRAFDSNKFA